jgi:hypothetical protein
MSSSARLQSLTINHPTIGSLGNLSTTSLPVTGGGVDDRKDTLKVDLYYRDRNKLSAFLIQLKLIFKLNLTKFDTRSSKVIYTTMYLKGSAFI